METYSNGRDDAVWRALAHPLRRRILDCLRLAPAATGDVVRAVGGGRHQVMQHLAILRGADLVLVERQGRFRMNHLNPVPIQQIYERWVSKYEQVWTAALSGLRDAAEAAHAAETEEARNVG